ncbi:4-hydroxy-tetrahydrodipicolinate reductase [Phenylobacterium sp.]|uniref:4-hydroxy-tetrahydrodipicolinate reductase n=1 Tax=Phenylobacterium sp. TaxID=1871053 RepID=UPI002737E475|nr:4-hydroxy-tetrahydrodipicolinate reductase [Phenylobacterium sp.]MDP3870864.1 4-hydroxy-tetrahydrodipicolinate reductase [Phenylobacterium sp.]
MTLRIGIHGATGRMGQALIQAVGAVEGARLAAAIAPEATPGYGLDAGSMVGLPPLGLAVHHDLAAAVPGLDVLIDFTRPEGTLLALALCQQQGKALVIGTTGFTPEQKAAIAAAARQIPIVLAANFSIGVNVVLKLLEQAGALLKDGYDVEIVEAHHRHKVDAPSGTALRMGEAVATGLGRDLKTCAVYERYGHTGARESQTIGFSTVRGGDVVGDHSVLFLGDGERVEIAHKATSRMNFARGAVRAAQWLASARPGLYDMPDVLGL